MTERGGRRALVLGLSGAWKQSHCAGTHLSSHSEHLHSGYLRQKVNDATRRTLNPLRRLRAVNHSAESLLVSSLTASEPSSSGACVRSRLNRLWRR